MEEFNSSHIEAALTVNLATCNHTNVQVWFAQLNAIFNAKRISSQRNMRTSYKNYPLRLPLKSHAS